MPEQVDGQADPASESGRRSAQHLERSAGAVKDSADRRTELTADRTGLAAERTYAAWVRTGLASLASGVGAKALLARMLPAWLGAAAGSMLIVFNLFCFAAAVWREASPITDTIAPDTRRFPAAF